MTADLLRDKFLSFFRSKKHKIVESDSLVPKDDPTVLFTPAGMNQFKKEFLGFDSGFKRAATAQRCLRTDDLDKVGKTLGHHTFFEMLGNFSFGDYFKEEAISFAWEFLTQELKIKEDKLWVSVYKDDTEAYKIWRDLIKVPADKIKKLSAKENFWPSEAKEKGPNGPCGPCSEIFFNQVEVWNLVFTQYNRKDKGVLEPLPKKNIDTGMGLERLVAVMQGVENNFETELFQPLVKEIAENVKKRSPNKKIIYAVSDHIRAITFAIYDGVLPSNDGRGYVVRKLIRRSILHLWGLGIKEPFLYTLVPVVSEIMESPYPDLKQRRENISEIILAEEKNFISSFHSSDALFKEKFSELLKNPDPKRAGEIAFQLYDTYGLPLEITCDWLEKKGLNLSKEAFDKELNQQKTRSKLQSQMKGDVFVVKSLDYGKSVTKFLGHKDYSTRAKITKIIKDDLDTSKINQGEEAVIILDKSVFYPESGGQVGDTGELVKGKNVFSVSDTKKIDKAVLHIGKVKAGSFKKNDFVAAKVNCERRLSIARNHTATHLLQAALRKVLGGHIQQQGSLVAEDRLRFDFTHFKALTAEQINRVEEIVNGIIMNNEKLSTIEMPLAKAHKTGALAFFGEKYESKVRVVSIADVSKELCGGTHLESTGQIGLFKIIQEGSVASGIRRIEAVTAGYALKKTKEEEEIVNNVASSLGVAKDKVIQELDKRLAKVRELQKRLNAQILDITKPKLDELIEKAEIIKGTKVIAAILEDLNMDLLRKNVDLIKEKTDNAIIALGSKLEGRALLVLGVTTDLCNKGLDATQLIRQISGIIGGSGGGRSDFAQAGGNKPEKLEESLLMLKNIIGNLGK